MQSRAAVGRCRGPPLWDHPQPSGRPRFGRSPPDDRGVPVRPAVDALYSDPEITALLRRYRIPRRHRPGGITDRFPTPARIPAGVPARRVYGHRAGRGAHRTTHRTPRRTGPGPAAPAPHPGPARRRPLPLLPPATPPPTMTRPDNPVPPVPRVDGVGMPTPGTDRTPPASGRPSSCTGVAPDAGAGTGRRVPAGVTPGVGRMARMQPEEVRAQPRGAVYRGDAVAVVAVLRGGGRW